jgi:hypothetical protein
VFFRSDHASSSLNLKAERHLGFHVCFKCLLSSTNDKMLRLKLWDKKILSLPGRSNKQLPCGGPYTWLSYGQQDFIAAMLSSLKKRCRLQWIAADPISTNGEGVTAQLSDCINGEKSQGLLLSSINLCRILAEG